MIQLAKTNPKDPDFIMLVKQLDAYLATTDGDEHAFYDQYNKPGLMEHVVIAYKNDKPLGCGAMKVFNEEAVEIKRMFTAPEARGQGVASMVLAELEKWAQELGYRKSVLETGKRQMEAIAFYPRKGYLVIPNFEPYIGMENSICFEKMLL